MHRAAATCARVLALVGALAQGGTARAVTADCEHLKLSLDKTITPAVVDRDWGSGIPHAQRHAVIELHDCAGELLDRLALDAPLARLDPTPLRGPAVPTWLVSVDLSAPAGSYNGPLTLAVEIRARHLHVAEARDEAGKLAPLQLPATGKAAWKRVQVDASDNLLAIASEPRDGGFVTALRRYRPGVDGWTVIRRDAPGLWESDADFPASTAFP
jgi:hypothetical protein